MKNIYLILILFVSTIYCQKGEAGLRIQFGMSDKVATAIGAGVNYTINFDDISYTRLLFEFSFNNFRNGYSKRDPFVSLAYYSLLSIKLQYLHRFGSKFYTGAGVGYFNYISGLSNSSDYEGYHYVEQEINNTFGADILIGLNFGNIAFEIDYVFSSPDLTSLRAPSESAEEFRSETEKANLNMLYINLIYSFYFIE